MPEAVLRKNPTKVAAGRAGARARWGKPEQRKIVRIDSLTTEQRAVVLALVDAARSGKADSDAA